MTPAKLNVNFAFYPYGGNGGFSSEHPNLRSWFARTLLACKADRRIGRVDFKDFVDTPIPMTRNRSVLWARETGADVLVMVDSDQHPDILLGSDPRAMPFFDSSFDLVYRRKLAGKMTVVGAPYCGPPPVENVYVFRWDRHESGHPGSDFEVKAYERGEAATLEGFHPAAALPTGCIMFDMQVFDATDPRHECKALLEKYGDAKIARALTNPWFYYEWDDIYQAGKASTEDVTATRDMGMLVQQKEGYNPLYCNWSAWAGHWKPKLVVKPEVITLDQVGEKYCQAVLEGRRQMERLVHLKAGVRDGVPVP